MTTEPVKSIISTRSWHYRYIDVWIIVCHFNLCFTRETTPSYKLLVLTPTPFLFLYLLLISISPLSLTLNLISAFRTTDLLEIMKLYINTAFPFLYIMIHNSPLNLISEGFTDRYLNELAMRKLPAYFVSQQNFREVEALASCLLSAQVNTISRCTSTLKDVILPFSSSFSTL